jgi:hypothetical protein
MVGLFAPDGQPLAGNLPTLPPDVRVDGPAQESVFPLTGTSVDKQTVRAIARRLPIGAVVVVGRTIDEAAEIADIVGATLGMGLIPALYLSVGAGIFLSMRAQKRVAEVNKKVQRIVAGDLRERLPARGVMIHSTNWPLSSAACWPISKLSSTRLPAWAITSRTTCGLPRVSGCALSVVARFRNAGGI